MHTCDNPTCVNFNHLVLGTQAENMKDRNQKGRHWVYSGDSHYMKRKESWMKDPDNAEKFAERNAKIKATKREKTLERINKIKEKTNP